LTRRALLFSAGVLAAREPRKLATILGGVYGQQVNQPVYTETFALLGRLRLGHSSDALRALVEPFARQTPAKLTPSHLSGALIYPEVGLTGAAERLAAEAHVELYAEMSDGMFMGPPLLARVEMYDAAVEHSEAIQKLCLRKDGLYRHSPLHEAAWGRGNAFPALGMAMTLEHLPKKQRGYAELLSSFQKLCQTLARFQTSNGLWRQVIDHESSFEEFSATAMIGAAMKRGLKRKWLKGDPYETCVRDAYVAIDRRTRDDGSVEGVCESTGKQKSLEAYLTRRAINGIDGRGGAMALYFATEMER
jgi:hypothetical protein